MLSGFAAPGSPIICILSGSTIPLTEEQLAELYTSRDDYLASTRAATDEMIGPASPLSDDRDQILDWASPERVSG